jgi:hypothetical protein
MRQTVSTLVLVAVALIVVAGNVSAWETRFEGSNGQGLGVDVVVDAAGDAVATGTQTDLIGDRFTVVKLAGTDGSQVWRYVAPGGGNGYGGEQVATDGAGDVFAAGRLASNDTVVKLAGTDGTELWQTGLGHATFFATSDLVTAPNGDAILLAALDSASPAILPTVARLAGGSGTVVWKHAILGTAGANDIMGGVALDPSGDVVVAASPFNTGRGSDLSIAKLSGATGAEIWRRDIDGGVNSADVAFGVTADSNGDVIAVGSMSGATLSGFTVVKVAGATGTELWRFVLDSNPVANYSFALDVATDAANDVFAVGKNGRNAMQVVKLSGLTGTKLWGAHLAMKKYGSGESVRVDAAGDAVFTGFLGFRFSVLKYRGADGRKLWRRTLKGDADNLGEAHGLDLDSSGNAVATGVSVFPLIPGQMNAKQSFTVVKACRDKGKTTLTPCP